MARLTDLPEFDQRRHLDRILALPDFGPTPFVPGPPLRERRVAIVTTSGIHERGARPFEVGSADYRVIAGDTPPGDVVMSHISVNFDRTGFQEDLNVVFPLERLRELHKDGVVGAISDFHYSFMGASPIQAFEPKARELAGLMKKDRVDAVLLVPVWPACTCAVGALGHFIEREGVPTAQISLIREQTAAIKPSRALWVPFMLGRPFGAPNAPDFQRRVLRTLLTLFERPSGPVLEDFPEDAPTASADETAFACPVSLAGAEGHADDPGDAMQREIAQLAPSYDIARERRGRTTVGVSGMTIEEAARYAAGCLGGAPARPSADGLSAGVALKRVCDDLKAYYYEAVAAQPGNLTPQAVDRWFWHETAAAKVFIALRAMCLRSDDPSLRPLGELVLVPRAIVHTLVEPPQPA